MDPNRMFYVVVDIPEPVARAVTEARRRFSPMRAEYPVEIGIAGSSGVGPIHPDQADDEAFEILTEVAAAVSPFEARFTEVRRFPGTDLFHLAPANRAPFDDMHARLLACGIQFYDSPHPYSPHCTISGVHLTETQAGEIRALRIDEPFRVERMAVYSEPRPVQQHFSASLTGPSQLSGLSGAT